MSELASTPLPAALKLPTISTVARSRSVIDGQVMGTPVKFLVEISIRALTDAEPVEVPA